MSNQQLSRIVVKGFKSLKSCDIRLGQLNILIGPNGAGKSNFISFFRLIQQLIAGNLQHYAGKQGGPDALLHFGRKITEVLEAELYFGNNGYRFSIEATADNRLMFAHESLFPNISDDKTVGSGHFETRIGTYTTGIKQYVIPALKSWRVYHFHDTSETAAVKQLCDKNDYRSLRPDAGNLASFLFYLKNKHPKNYELITKTVRMIAPFFGDFLLETHPLNEEKIELEWTQQGHDIPFKAHVFSDGTLRFICLATVLLQPTELMPETILIDEPELGLHPYAIRMLGSMLRSASAEKQIIVSTQSADLLNEFTPKDVILAERANGSTNLLRPDESALTAWLEDYTLGELWQKNLIGGRP